MTVISVPTINDGKADLATLHRLWLQAIKAEEVRFEFGACRFLRQNAVAFLGGLIRLLQFYEVPVKIRTKTIDAQVRKNLAKNGFGTAMWGETIPWTDNAIPFREDLGCDERGFIEYLTTHWLGKGWVDVSPRLRDAIIERVAETYLNAFEHAASPIGVFSCGQYYPRMKQLRLSLVDFGVGIPSNVRLYRDTSDENPDARSGADCLEWAFRRGTSTKAKAGRSRGLGLDLLRKFIQLNQGSLDIYSHDGHASVIDNGVSYATLPHFFEGTLVNICIQCDDHYYTLASENVSDVKF